MLYTGDLVIADTICSDLENHCIEKLYRKLLEKNLYLAVNLQRTLAITDKFFLRLWRKINFSMVDISEICLKQ